MGIALVKSSAMALVAALVLSACGGYAVYARRTSFAPSKPVDCAVESLGDRKFVEGYEVIGTVSLVLRKYQVLAGKEMTLDEEAARALARETCKLGGDAFSFMDATSTGANFLVMRKRDSSPARAAPPAGTGT